MRPTATARRSTRRPDTRKRTRTDYWRARWQRVVASGVDPDDPTEADLADARALVSSLSPRQHASLYALASLGLDALRHALQLRRRDARALRRVLREVPVPPDPVAIARSLVSQACDAAGVLYAAALAQRVVRPAVVAARAAREARRRSRLEAADAALWALELQRRAKDEADAWLWG